MMGAWKLAAGDGQVSMAVRKTPLRWKCCVGLQLEGLQLHSQLPEGGYPLLQHGSSDKGQGSFSLTSFSSTTPGSHLQWVPRCAHCRNTMVQPFCNALRASACNNKCRSPSSSRLGGMWSASQMNAIRLSFSPEFCQLCTLLPSLPSAACFPKMSWNRKFNSSISSSALFIGF